MSLDYEFSGIKNWQVVTTAPQDRELLAADPKAEVHRNPITEALVWGLFEIGIGHITEKNADDVWFRLTAHDLLYGDRISYFDEKEQVFKKRHVTLDEVKEHIGLRTNVSSLTANEWKAALFRRITSRVGDIKGTEVKAKLRETPK